MAKTEDQMGKVSVVDGKYKIQGTFHVPEPNQPIFNAETGKLAGVTNPRDMTYIHSYGGEAIFFESLSKGKLLATRCDNEKCESKGSMYQPFRIYCPDCLKKATPVDITKKTAVIYSYIVTERSGAFNALKTPINFINVKFEGVSTILMGYLAVGEPKMGITVVPIFNTKKPTYTIIDIAWVPVRTPESALPENFTF